MRHFPCRLCFRNVLDATDCDHGDQGDAPLADHGGLLLAHRRQVRRHAEGEGTEKGTGISLLGWKFESLQWIF